MLTVRIEDIDFPLTSLSEMQLVRDRYSECMSSVYKDTQNSLHIQGLGISTPTLVSVRDFMERFSGVQIIVLLPRIKPVKDLIGEDLQRWLSGLNNHGLRDLHRAAHLLGYSSLCNVISLILSEVINYTSL